MFPSSTLYQAESGALGFSGAEWSFDRAKDFPHFLNIQESKNPPKEAFMSFDF